MAAVLGIVGYLITTVVGMACDIYASISGVAKLGHTGECALATTGCAPPVQVYNRILGTDSIVVDHKLGATFTLHELAVSDHDLYCTV